MQPSVMIVEDDEIIREIYALKFELEGYPVQVANNGAEALRALAGFQPHFILLDMMMPVMDGVGFMQNFPVKEHPHTEVIIFSNVSAPVQMEAVRRMGAHDYWVKSDYTPEQLVANIARRWHERQASASPQ